MSTEMRVCWEYEYLSSSSAPLPREEYVRSAGRRSVTLRLGSFERRKGNSQECIKVSCPPLSIQVKCRKRQGWKGCDHFIPGANCAHVSPPPLDIVCWNCRASGHMQRECTQPRRSFVCLRCNKEGHFARECPEAPSAGFKGGKGKGSPQAGEKERERAVSRRCSRAHFPRPPHQIESAMVVQGEEGYLQAVFCVVLPV